MHRSFRHHRTSKSIPSISSAQVFLGDSLVSGEAPQLPLVFHVLFMLGSGGAFVAFGVSYSRDLNMKLVVIGLTFILQVSFWYGTGVFRALPSPELFLRRQKGVIIGI